MPSLKSIRKRIGSMKNTRKITRAMKLVAAARLRRAQEAIIAARPYAQTLTQVMAELVAVAGTEAHPLFEKREGQRTQIIVLTSDRGLAGPFNAQAIRKVERLVREDYVGHDIDLRIVGKKGNTHFARRSAKISSFELAPTNANALEYTREVAIRAVGDFIENRVDRVILVFNEFKGAGSQDTVARQLLPIVADSGEGAISNTTEASPLSEYIYEPGKQQLLARLAPLFLQTLLFRAALESIASEFGARMMAMENATKNAGELIRKLTLQYNRARQASITKELLEIIGGAEALKG